VPPARVFAPLLLLATASVWALITLLLLLR
jgi:hypothetical protein